ncbi:MAG: hypothetical protein EOQ47_08740 [Mesorhizobium sp.]|nr:MAG: hypothetical protein EOQ47_08740 [Mesorhizobium sp.]
MSRKSVQRFCENDMHKNKDLKRVAWIHFSATRFRRGDFAVASVRNCVETNSQRFGVFVKR